MDPIVQDLIYSLSEEEIYKNHRIQHKESYILRLITLAYMTNKTLKVSDLQSNKDLGSQPSIQSYITKLVGKKFIHKKVNEMDKRVVYLTPTENAIDLFRQLSKTLYDLKVSASS
jgi:DNA-binding MarR family transcriptional regulator